MVVQVFHPRKHGTRILIPHIRWQERWRRDLNPRTVLAVSRFQGECIRPLCHATAGNRTPVPRRARSHAPDGIGVQPPVGGEQIQTLSDRLRHQHPVERVTVVPRQLA